MSILRRLTVRGPEARATTLLDLLGSLRGRATFAGPAVSSDSALRHITVYACRRLLADSVAALPIHAYRRGADGFPRMLDPTPTLLADPWPEILPYDWAFRVVESLVGRGNAFLVAGGRDRLGWPTMLMPVHPDDVTARRAGDRRTGPVEWKINGETVPSEDIVHIPAFTIAGQLLGVNPIEMARQTVGIGLAVEEFAARWFGDDSPPASVIETPETIGDDEARRLVARWVASQGGTRRPAVLSGGAQWKAISITPNESQFLETQKFSVAQIARLHGVPPHMVGDVERSTSWGSGIEEQGRGFVTYTLRPWLTRIEQALTRQLPRGVYVRFNVDGLLRADTLRRYQAYVQARNAGWLSVNEIRELEDRPAVDGGDTYVQPLNMGPLGINPLTGGPDAQP